MENDENKRIFEGDDGQLMIRRALPDPKLGHSICTRLIDDNKERNNQNAEILKKYNGGQPFNPKDLEDAGQDWRNNRATGFMSNIVVRALPPYLAVWESARYLTNSTLASNDPESEQKNIIFREAVTKTIRSWSGWKNIAYLTVFENVLFGYTACAFPDKFDWRPLACRTDSAFFPDNCSQDSSYVPVWVMKHDYQIHELTEKIVDRELAESVGWNFDNCVEAINFARPKNRLDNTSEGVREYQDFIRETTLATSYQQGVDVIETSQLFIQEPNKAVSHFIYNHKNGKILYQHLDKFESMEECLALFSVEIGNGKLHGSKGAGRILFNTHVSAEQARNLVADNLYLAGMLILEQDGNGSDDAALNVAHPVAVVSQGYKLASKKFEVNTEAFFALDRHMQQVAEMQVGVFMPTQFLEGQDANRPVGNSKIIDAEVQKIRDSLLSRHLGQQYRLIHIMQKRLCSQENIMNALSIFNQEQQTGRIVADPRLEQFRAMLGKNTLPLDSNNNVQNQEAIDCILSMLRQGLEPDDIYELALCPPNEVLEDPANNSQIIANIRATYMGHPNVRQTELITRDIASQVGYNVAQELIIPEEDNTITSESTRLQLIELQTLMTGESLPTSPRDNDKIHMNVIIQKSKPIMEGLMQGGFTEDTLAAIGNVMAHFNDHLNGARSKGMQDSQLQDELAFYNSSQAALEEAAVALKQLPQSGIQNQGVPAIQPPNQEYMQ